MSKIHDEVLAANKAYVGNFADKGKLPMPPGRHFCHPDLYGREA